MATPAATGRRLLGEILRGLGYVTEEQIQAALAHQKRAGGRIGEALVALGHAQPLQVTKALAKQFGLPYVDLTKSRIPQSVLEAVPANVASESLVMPVKRNGGTIVLALSDPTNVAMLDDLRFTLGAEIELALAAPDALRDAIARHYGGGGAAAEAAAGGAAEAKPGEDDEAPIIRLVQQIITDAVRVRASDIHVEPMNDRLRVRYRVDGLCREVEAPPKRLQPSILSRLKIMAGMDIAEKRKPQDGRINITLENRELDLRVSSLPASHGESLVMRILDRERGLVSLGDLGFLGPDYERFQRIIRRPNGIFLVTGPTGSGKTTTLYAALKDLNRPDVKIITAEEPVEYHLGGINQVQVRRRIGLTFARILRSMLRQAPNILLVGEIRDAETAEIAIQAALTGHLVFSTLHTNDSPSALTRLIDMGVKPFLVASSVQAIMAQRLVRNLCQKCREPYEPPPSELRAIGLRSEDLGAAQVFRPTGCSACSGTGYRGRSGIFELLEMSPKLRELTFHKGSTVDLRTEARASGGLKTLLEDGVKKILAGVTTVDEVLRMTARTDLAY
ncbi:MAG: Flp pilus assembly complex ATPase component TadA [Planctomycetales bacterium]|nr:Flp pilus assembly complex ATPase component TadA [Planctomycetales bacterium]